MRIALACAILAGLSVAHGRELDSWTSWATETSLRASQSRSLATTPMPAKSCPTSMNTTCWQWDTCPQGDTHTGAWVVSSPMSCVDLTAQVNLPDSPHRTGVGELTDVGTWSFPGWDGAVQMWESQDCSGSPITPLAVDMPLCTGAPYDFNFAGLVLGRTLPVVTKIKSLMYMGCASSS